MRLRMRLVAAAPEPLSPNRSIAETPEAETQHRQRGLAQRLLWVVGTTLALLFAWYLSMLLTSRNSTLIGVKQLAQAIALLQQQGLFASRPSCSATWSSIAKQTTGGTDLSVTTMPTPPQTFRLKW